MCDFFHWVNKNYFAQVVEYSEINSEQANMRTPTGQLVYRNYIQTEKLFLQSLLLKD